MRFFPLNCFIAIVAVFVVNVQLLAQVLYDDTVDLASLPKILSTPVTVAFDRISLDEAIQEIALKGKLDLVFSSLLIPAGKLITLKKKRHPAIKLLYEILKNTGTEMHISRTGQITIVPEETRSVLIKGMVVDSVSGNPLEGANIIITGTRRGTVADDSGVFTFDLQHDLEYFLSASMMGYKSKEMPVSPAKYSHNAYAEVLVFNLARNQQILPEIIVTPRHYAINNANATTVHSMTENEVKEIPKFGDDIFRAAARLPGVTTLDFSSRFSVRGGKYDEVLILLDGMELYDPFHLKEVDGGGVFSAVDIDVLRGFELMTGAFPVKYGNKRSGVFNIQSAIPEKRQTTVGISLRSAKILSEGVFNNNKGSWLLTFRNGFTDLLYNFTGNNIKSPKYYDSFGKLHYTFSPSHKVAFHYLVSNDKFTFKNNDVGEEAESHYKSAYYWLSWKALLTDNLFVNSYLAINSNSHIRNGRDTKDFRFPSFEIFDDRDFKITALRQQWDYIISDNLLFSWGGQYKYVNADYDYFKREKLENDTNGLPPYERINTQKSINGDEIGFYLDSKIKFFSKVINEVGLRYDYSSWVDEKTVSPRINVSYFLNDATVLRFGYGEFFQNQSLQELDVQYGEDEFFRPELSVHTVLGMEHTFRNNLILKVETYLKKSSRIRPVNLNVANPFNSLFPEISNFNMLYNPEKSNAKGVEVFVKKNRTSNSRFHWWTSYSLSQVEDWFNGKKIPGIYDQRHMIIANINYYIQKTLLVNIGWQFRSGWPFTDSNFVEQNSGQGKFVKVYNRLNSSRLPDYHRLDFKITKELVHKYGNFNFYLEVLNLYNNENVFLIEKGLLESTGIELKEVPNKVTFFSFSPSFGMTWRF